MFTGKRKSNLLKICAVLLAMTLTSGACGAAKEYESYQLGGEVKQTTDTEASASSNTEAPSTDAPVTAPTSSDETTLTVTNETDSSPTVPSSDDSIFERLPNDDGSSDNGGFVVNSGPNTAYQLTEADIQSMNNNKAVIIRSNQGYVSTLVGKYYDGTVKVIPGEMSTFEEGINTLNGIATLLGMQAGTEFLADNGEQDKEGYTYLTYRQRYGSDIVQNATLHIVIDPAGYPCAVSSSFTPNIGIKSDSSGDITAAEAEKVASQTLSQNGYPSKVYSAATACVSVNIFGDLYRCWVVFSDNPQISAGFENMMYLANYISMSGEFLQQAPSSTLSVTVDQGFYDNDKYFEGLQSATWTGTVNFKNLGTQNITVPVAYDPKTGTYYLMDTKRKIAVADFYKFCYQEDLQFLSSTNNTWDERDLACYYNYSLVYDCYAAHNIKSPDGFGTPMLLCRHFSDQNGQQVDNAVFVSLIQGWLTFGYSELNNFCYDLDAMAHEFTHAVTFSSIEGNNYQNDAGAVNEAYSDVMGNIVEMLMGRSSDTLWELSENSNETLRSMSNPNKYQQPLCIGDVYYVPNVLYPNQMCNDCGGVHTNSSIVNYAAYLLYKQGMPLEDMFDLFYTSLQILTPANNFQDVYAALIYSARSNGYTAYESMLTNVFTQNGVLSENRQAVEKDYKRSGYGRIYFRVSSEITGNYYCLIYLYDMESGSVVLQTWPDTNGYVSFLAPVNTYLAIDLQVLDSTLTQGVELYYTDSGWDYAMNGAQPMIFTMEDGEFTTIADLK